MAESHAKPGDVIDTVDPIDGSTEFQNTTLVKADRFDVRRLVLPRGKQIPEHKAAGPMTLVCLDGVIAFTALGRTNRVAAGQMLYLEAGEPHSLSCLEDATVLVTRLSQA